MLNFVILKLDSLPFEWFVICDKTYLIVFEYGINLIVRLFSNNSKMKQKQRVSWRTSVEGNPSRVRWKYITMNME